MMIAKEGGLTYTELQGLDSREFFIVLTNYENGKSRT